MQNNDLILFTRKALVALLVVTMSALVLKLSYLLMLVFASVVVAVILRGLASRFLAFRVNDGLAVTLAVVALLGIIGTLGWLFGGLVSDQFMALGRELPGAIDLAQRQLTAWHIDYDLPAIAKAARSQFAAIFTQAGGFVISAGGVVADVAVVFVGGVFFAADPALYRGGLLRLLPQSVEPLMRDTLDDAGRGLGLWLKGQMISSLAIAVMTYTGLTVLGVPSAFALALIAGALDFIPYLGPLLAAVPGVLVAFSVGPVTALWTTGLFMVVQQIQNNVVQPLIQKSAIDLPPAVALFSMIATGTIFGVTGVLLATPMTITGYILVQHLYIGGLLGRQAKRPAAPKG